MDGDGLPGMRSGRQEAGRGTSRFQGSGGWWDSFGDDFDRGMQSYPCPTGIGHLRKRFRNEGDEVSLRGLAGLELCRGLDLAFDAIDAEGAPVFPSHVPRHEVPAITRMYQLVRLDDARAGAAGAAVVAKSDLFTIAAGTGNRGQSVGIDGCPTAT